MFQKGPMPGYSPKTKALKINPSLFCKRYHYYMFGFVYEIRNVYNINKTISCAGSAVQAWQKALEQITKHAPDLKPPPAKSNL